MKGRYHVEVIDLLEQPQLARGDQILGGSHVGAETPRTAEANHRRLVQRGTGVGWTRFAKE